MIVEYHPAVRQELEDARGFYESQVSGFGAEFLDEFDRQVRSLAAAPVRWMVLPETSVAP